jgi:hypothetical protein
VQDLVQLIDITGGMEVISLPEYEMDRSLLSALEYRLSTKEFSQNATHGPDVNSSCL